MQLYAIALSTLDDCDNFRQPIAEQFDRELWEILASSHGIVA
jgi:hypothetical protein